MNLTPKQRKDLTQFHSKKKLEGALMNVQSILEAQTGNAESMKVLKQLCTINGKVIALREKLSKIKE